MNKEPLVSVIITTFNRSEFLKGAIQTAFCQTYDHLEIIVVDDGSDEPYSEEIANTFPKEVKLIRHEENRGLSAARNTGIRNAKGNYIAFLDDDDRWQKRKIEKQVHGLEDDETAGLATCLSVSVNMKKDIVHTEFSAPSGDCSNELLVTNSIGSPSRILVRRQAIEDIGPFDEKLETKQDWDFYIRLSQQYNILSINEILCFRLSHSSMSSDMKSAIRDSKYIINKHENIIKSSGAWERSWGNYHRKIGKMKLKQGALEKARCSLIKSARYDLKAKTIMMLLLSFTHGKFIRRSVTVKRGLNGLLRRKTYEDDIKETLDEIRWT